jgi:hypothetical protein
MVGKIIRKINADTQLTIDAEGDTLMDVLFQLTPIINMPKTCGKCESENITIKTSSVKSGEFQYIYYVCCNCDARMTWGEYKSPKGTFFLKQWEGKDDWKNKEPKKERDE